MLITPHKKIWVIVGAFLVLIVMVLITPFVVTVKIGIIPREGVQAFFVIAEFLATVYLLNEFNRLRIIVKKQEMGNKNLTDIESDIKKLSNLR